MSLRVPVAALLCLPFFGCLESPDSPDRGSVSASISVAPSPCVGTYALPRMAALASSQESPALAAGNAIDGNAATRWSSAFSDPQWLRIDLGAVRFITGVTLRWEAASAQRYDIQVSNDGNSWRAVQTVNWGNPGPTTMPFTGLNARGRYLRVYAYSRTTPYGISLYEVDVKGDPNGACSEPSAVHIDAVSSGRSLDVKDWNPNPGALIQQWGYGGGANQKWKLTNVQDNQYEIRSVFSDLCLDVKDWSTADGAQILQWICHGGANQRFTLEPASGGAYKIRAVHSGKCLDVKDWNPNDGGLIQQWTCAADQANQKWNLADPQDLQTDPNNCGRAGHGCQGGACVEGVCQAVQVASDFQCSSGMAADEQSIWIGDQGGLFRYDASGYNKTSIWKAPDPMNPGWFWDLQRSGSQFFWSDFSKAQRLADGQSSPTALTDFQISQMALEGNDLVGLDYAKSRFVAVDRATGALRTVHAVPSGEYPMYSAVTPAYLYYASGNSNGTTLWQVNRSNGQRKAINGPGESIFGITAFDGTAYWNYGTPGGGATGIRKLSSAAGATVLEAVPPAGTGQGVGLPAVDGSGIYHPFSDASGSAYYRTPLDNPKVRTLVTKGFTYPYDSRYVRFTSTSIVWLIPCNRGGGGLLFRLAKP